MGDEPPKLDADTEPQWRVALCFCLMLIGIYVIACPIIRLSDWQIGLNNHGWIEAKAWWSGRIDLPIDAPAPEVPRPRDTAWFDGKVYNVFPPLWTFISYVTIGLLRLQSGWGELTAGDVDAFYAPWYVGIVALPLPIVGFWAFRNAIGRSDWAAVLTGCWILGTPLFSLLFSCREGEVNSINHVISNTALMLIAADLLGARRIWPAAVGLVLGAWTRQLTFLFLPAILYVAWQSAAHRVRNMLIVGVAAVIAVGTLASLNWLKFGNPLDNGYAHIYTGRTDEYARRFREHSSVFDPRYIPRNLYQMNIALPEARISRMRLILDSHGDGVSLWLTSPVLLYGIFFVRRWWHDPTRRALMLSSALVLLGILCYHTTGSVQKGMYRFAMDFAPIWLVVIAPWVTEVRHRYILLACFAWSALYFHIFCLSQLG